MPVDVNKQLRHLPFGIVQKLVPYLEPPSNKDWQALIRVMPEDRFSQSDVNLIKIEGSKANKTCTDVMWRELCHLCVKVKEFGLCLKEIKNYEALAALDWPHEPVVINTQPESTVLSEGQDLRLKVAAVGFPLPTYQWYKNDQPITDAETCELRITGVSAADSGKYKCIISNDVSECTSNTAKVQVMRAVRQVETEPAVAPVPVIIAHPRSQHVLAGDHHVLHCDATGERPMTYLWYKDGKALLNSNTPHLEIRLFGEQDVGSYSCKVTNSFGDDVSDIAELTIGQIGREIRHVATDKIALLIGNQDYTANFPDGFQGQGALKHTITDTRTLGSLLHSEEMGFNVLSFANLSRDEMEKAVHEFLSLLSEDCYVVFYFAGHGFELNGKHYLVPVDAPPQWTQVDAICIQWILEAIWKSRPKLTVFLLDTCRVMPENRSKAIFEEYDFPRDLKIVFGFATCSQSESYERVDDDNGIYMKYLKKHICRDVKIEDVLHDVTTEVEAETAKCTYTEHQRPEYVSKGGGYYSLRDPVRPIGNTSAERWLQAHKLPENRTIEFENGVKVEVRFEHCNWLTNTINIFVGVVDPGITDHSYAYIYQLPNGLESHFPNITINANPENTSTVDNCPPNPMDFSDETDIESTISARSWPQSAPRPRQRIPNNTRLPSLEMFHLQRLFGNLTVTIALVCDSRGERTTKYKVEVFSESDFGLAEVFHGQ